MPTPGARQSTLSAFRAPLTIFWTGLLIRVLYITIAHTYRFSPFEDHFTFGYEMARVARALVTGFMLPVRVEGGLTSNFLLLRNQSACCYGVMPRVNEWVIVRMAGRGVKPVMDVPITALGTFHVGDVRENGQLVGIYMLDCNQLLSTR